MWRRVADAVERYRGPRLAGRFEKSAVLVGQDRYGNKYYQLPPEMHGLPARKHVEYASADYNPRSLHPLWYSWAYGHRIMAPTEEDIDTYDEEQRILKERVRKLEEKDTKLRLEQLAQLQRDGVAESGHSSQYALLDSVVHAIRSDAPNMAGNAPKPDGGKEAPKAGKGVPEHPQREPPPPPEEPFGETRKPYKPVPPVGDVTPPTAPGSPTPPSQAPSNMHGGQGEFMPPRSYTVERPGKAYRQGVRDEDI